MGLSRLLERHRAFWHCEPAVAPLVGKVPTRTWKKRPFPLAEGRILQDPEEIHPGDIDVDRMVGADLPPEDLTVGELIQPRSYRFPTAWMGALIGCPVRASAYGCVARSPGVDLAPAARDFSVDDALRSGWIDVMDAVLARSAELAGSEQPVRQLHLRGIIDMLAAFLGEDTLCLSALDAPGELVTLAAKFVDVHNAVARRGREQRPAWRGGTVSGWLLHAPGPNLDYQVDASSLFSARTYEQHFLDHDREVLATAPYNMTHLHACGLHVLDALLKLTEARAFQVNLDRETGTWHKDDVLGWCRRIQEAGKALIICGELDENEFAEFCDALSPAGLAFHYWNP